MESGIRRAKSRGKGESGATCIMYLGDFGLSNMDYSVVRYLIDALANYYPETLANVLLVDAPWIFSTVWPLISGWIDPRTSQKIKFIAQAELINFIDIQNLSTLVGGSWVWKYERITPAVQRRAPAAVPVPTNQ